MTKPDTNGWRYTPGLWYRTDGARVERQTTGKRKGVWKARLPGDSIYHQKMILTDGTIGDPLTLVNAATSVSWQGFGTAATAKNALDKIRHENEAKTAQLIREAFANPENNFDASNMRESYESGGSLPESSDQ